MPLSDSIFLCSVYIALLTAYGVISERGKQRKEKKKIVVRVAARNRATNSEPHDELSKEAV